MTLLRIGMFHRRRIHIVQRRGRLGRMRLIGGIRDGKEGSTQSSTKNSAKKTPSPSKKTQNTTAAEKNYSLTNQTSATKSNPIIKSNSPSTKMKTKTKTKMSPSHRVLAQHLRLKKKKKNRTPISILVAIC
jgi:hypothetical protein